MSTRPSRRWIRDAVNTSGEILELGTLQGDGTWLPAPPGTSSTGGNGENGSTTIWLWPRVDEPPGSPAPASPQSNLDVEVDYYTNCAETAALPDQNLHQSTRHRRQPVQRCGRLRIAGGGCQQRRTRRAVFCRRRDEFGRERGRSQSRTHRSVGTGSAGREPATRSWAQRTTL